MRAKRVIFLARLGAGRRGAEMIEVDDLLAALLLGHQNKLAETVWTRVRPGTRNRCGNLREKLKSQDVTPISWPCSWPARTADCSACGMPESPRKKFCTQSGVKITNS